MRYNNGYLPNRYAGADPYASSLVLAVPMATNFSDIRNLYNGGTNKTATVTGAVVNSTRFKYYGASGLFILAGTHNISFPNNVEFNFPGAFCIEMWFYPVAYGGLASTLYDRGYTSGGGLLIQFVGGAPLWIFMNGVNVKQYTGTPFPTGSWQHFRFNRDASNVCRLFNNGVQVGTDFTDSTNCNTAVPAVFGAGGGYGFDGNFQDIRVYKGTAKETTTFTPPTQIFNPQPGFIDLVQQSRAVTLTKIKRLNRA
jgi:hypothetical protein